MPLRHTDTCMLMHYAIRTSLSKELLLYFNVQRLYFSRTNRSLWYLRFSRHWLWRLLSSGMWRRVVLYKFTGVSEKAAAAGLLFARRTWNQFWSLEVTWPEWKLT